MDRKEAIREKILGLGVDVCGFGPRSGGLPAES